MASVEPPELSYKSMTFILYVLVHSRNTHVQISYEMLCGKSHTIARLLENSSVLLCEALLLFYSCCALQATIGYAI